MPGSPTTSASWPSPLRRPLPAPAQEVELLLAPDEGSERARAEAPAAARAHDPKKRRRLRHALQRMRAAILGDEQARDLTLHTGGDQHRPGSAKACTRAAILGASPKISPAASTTTGPLSTPMRATSSGRPERGVLCVEFGERALDGERRADRALGVVLLRDRVSEQRHQPVAELLGDTAAHLRHRLRRSVEIGADQIAPILRRRGGRNGGRAHEIAEHHGELPAFGGVHLIKAAPC